MPAEPRVVCWFPLLQVCRPSRAQSSFFPGFPVEHWNDQQLHSALCLIICSRDRTGMDLLVPCENPSLLLAEPNTPPWISLKGSCKCTVKQSRTAPSTQPRAWSSPILLAVSSDFPSLKYSSKGLQSEGLLWRADKVTVETFQQEAIGALPRVRLAHTLEF